VAVCDWPWEFGEVEREMDPGAWRAVVVYPAVALKLMAATES